MLTKCVQLGLLAGAAVAVGALSWYFGTMYWSKDEEDEEKEEQEEEEGVAYDNEGNAYSLEELRQINLDRIKKNCTGAKWALEDQFDEVPQKEIQTNLANAQVEEVFYASGPFLHKYGGLPAVHRALENYGDLVERTKWYAPFLKEGRNPYD